MENNNDGLMWGGSEESLREYLKHQDNPTAIPVNLNNGLTVNPGGGTGGPNYMTLPGNLKKNFQVFFQFDDDEPVCFAETRSAFVLTLSGTEHSSVGVKDLMGPDIEFSGYEDKKKFKIFLKRKS